MLLQFFKNLLNGINISVNFILSINQDIIVINNYEIIEVFSQVLINITLETGRSFY